MKVKWIEDYKKDVIWEIATPKSFPMARVISENDVPDVMEYTTEKLKSPGIWITREREGEITIRDFLVYGFRGYWFIEDIIRKKYKLENRYFQLLTTESPSQ